MGIVVGFFNKRKGINSGRRSGLMISGQRAPNRVVRVRALSGVSTAF